MFLSLRNSQFKSKRGGGGVRGRLRAIEESPLDKGTDISHRYIHVVYMTCHRVLKLENQNFKEH